MFGCAVFTAADALTKIAHHFRDLNSCSTVKRPNRSWILNAACDADTALHQFLIAVRYSRLVDYLHARPASFEDVDWLARFLPATIDPAKGSVQPSPMTACLVELSKRAGTP